MEHYRSVTCTDLQHRNLQFLNEEKEEMRNFSFFFFEKKEAAESIGKKL